MRKLVDIGNIGHFLVNLLVDLHVSLHVEDHIIYMTTVMITSTTITPLIDTK